MLRMKSLSVNELVFTTSILLCLVVITISNKIWFFVIQ